MFANNHSDSFIKTNDAHRERKWVRLFGVDMLPVKQARPRDQWLPLQECQVLAYDLDASRLHWMQRERFVDYICIRTGMCRKEAMQHTDGWPLVAEDCFVVTADLVDGERPSLSPHAVMAYSFA